MNSESPMYLNEELESGESLKNEDGFLDAIAQVEKSQEPPFKKLKMSSSTKKDNCNSQIEVLNTTNSGSKILYDKKTETNSKDNNIQFDLEISIDKKSIHKDIFKKREVNKLSTLAAFTIKTNYKNMKSILVSDKFTMRPQIISLACKYDLTEVLQHLFTENLNFNEIYAENINVQEFESHNAFYYAIRSGNTELLNALIDKLIKNSSQNQEIENLLSSAYEDLLLKNISVSEEMEIYVESKLIDLRFSLDNLQLLNNEPSRENISSEIKERIDMVANSINLLITEYSSTKLDIDHKFLFETKCIAKNIHVLKKLLKPTYDRVPWEEIEFCIVAFISSQYKEQEINLIYNSVLDKQELLDQLNEFSKALKNLKYKESEIYGVLPQIHRLQIIQQIKILNPHFLKLYTIYEQIKNTYSLEKIKYYAEVAVAENEDKNFTYLATERALQVTGEYIKNTIESPNMTDDISKSLLSTFHIDTKKIITSTRDRLSHVYTNKEFLLEKREEIRKFPLNVKNDLNKLKNSISMIIFDIKIQIIRKVLNDIANSQEIAQAKKYNSIFKNVPLNFIDLKTVTTTEFENIKEWIKKLKNEIKDQTNYEKDLFCKIENIFNIQKEKRTNINIHYTEGISNLKDIISKISSSENINVIRLTAKHMNSDLENSVYFEDTEIYKNFREIIGLTEDIYNSANPRLKRSYLGRILFEIFCIGEIKTGGIENIKKLKEKLEFKIKVDNVQNEINEILLCIKEKSEDLFDSMNYIIATYQKLIDWKKPSEEPEEQKRATEAFEILLKNIKKKQKKSNLIIFFQKLEWKKVQKGVQSLLKDYFEFTKGVRAYLKEKDFSKLTVSLLDLCKNWDDNRLNGMERIFIEISNEQNFRIKENFKKRLEILRIKYEMFPNKIDKIQNYKKNTTFAVANEMLVLDILAYLEEKLEILDSNKYGIASFLNRSFPTLSGKQLRNHLAHGIPLNDVLQPNSFINIICNATKLMEMVPFLSENNMTITIDQPIVNFEYFKAKYQSNLNSIENQQEFLNAAETGDIFKLKSCLNKGADINAKDFNNWNVLHYAFKGDRLEVVKLFLNNKLFDEEDVEGRKPLHVAAFFGSVEVLQFCIDKGIMKITSFFNSTKETLLHFAVQGSTSRKKLVLETLFHFIPSIEVKKFINLPDELGQTCLHNAAKYVLKFNEDNKTLNTTQYVQHLDVLKILMGNGADINSKARNGCTPLHIVALNGTQDMIKTLIGSKTIDANHKDNEQVTPLHKAAENGNNNAVEALIEFSDINCQDNEGYTPFHLAVLYGHKTVVETLLKANVEVNCKSYKGYTALHFASESISDEIITILLNDNRFEINVEDNNKDTPLHFAAQVGNKILVESFLKCDKIDINCRNCENLTPLHLAAENGHNEIVKILINIPQIALDCRCNMSFTPLHFASKNGNEEVVKSLITTKNVDVNCIDEENFTPLHLAATKGHANIFKILLTMCSDFLDVNLKCKEGYAPIHLAVQNNYKEIVDILIKHKEIDINICNNENLTPLHLAAYFGHNDILKILLDCKNINVNCESDGNQTPLHLAAQNGHRGIVTSLINVSNIHCVDNRNYTPLHFAAQNGHKDVVALFLRNNSLNINCITVDKSTPLRLAAENGHSDVVEILLTAKNVNVNAQCIEGRTPLYIAALFGHTDVITVLLKTIQVNVNIWCNNGFRALDIAVINKHKDIVTILLTVKDIETNYINKVNQSPLQITARYNIVEIAEELLMSKKVDVNFVNSIGMTAIICAACFGSIDVVKALIKVENIDLNCKDFNDFTPLHLAAIKGHKNVIDILLTIDRINVNCLTKNQCNPLQLAVVAGHVNAVETLLPVNNINVKCRKGFTVLHTAAAVGFEDIVNILLATKKLNINCKTKNGSTALHLAVRQGRENVVATLLTSGMGIQINCKNKNGSTPLHLAAAYGYKKIVIMLLKAKNINVNSLDKCKLTPIHAAFRNVRKEIIKILLKAGGKLGFECKCKKRFNYSKKFIKT